MSNWTRVFHKSCSTNMLRMNNVDSTVLLVKLFRARKFVRPHCPNTNHLPIHTHTHTIHCRGRIAEGTENAVIDYLSYDKGWYEFCSFVLRRKQYHIAGWHSNNYSTFHISCQISETKWTMAVLELICLLTKNHSASK